MAIITNPALAATVDEIVTACSERAGGYKDARSVVIRSEPLPKSGARKILKQPSRSQSWEPKSRRQLAICGTSIGINSASPHL
jgi:acyl-CoA synthetase (AMP-forming)/AMP-acid ligase II